MSYIIYEILYISQNQSKSSGPSEHQQQTVQNKTLRSELGTLPIAISLKIRFNNIFVIYRLAPTNEKTKENWEGWGGIHWLRRSFVIGLSVAAKPEFGS